MHVLTFYHGFLYTYKISRRLPFPFALPLSLHCQLLRNIFFPLVQSKLRHNTHSRVCAYVQDRKKVWCKVIMTLHAKVLSLIEGRQTLKNKWKLIKWLQKKKLLKAKIKSKLCKRGWKRKRWQTAVVSILFLVPFLSMTSFVYWYVML